MRRVATGAVLAVASVAGTALIPYPTTLGVMLMLSMLYLLTLYLLLMGVVELRHGDDGPVDDTGAPHPPRRHAWMCLLADHRFVRVPGRPEVAEHWRCRRCGRRRWTQPRSAGETLDATRVDMMWIKRGDDG